jgi:hypothetical protein
LRILRAILGRLLLLVFGCFIALVASEAAFSLLLSTPAVLAHLPDNTRSHLEAYYLQHDRSLLQALPECAQYDRGLFYTLKPGECRFHNREFDTQIRVNSAGVRDDEASLQAPEVVVLGDSFALGWGVQQDESFPELLEQRLGRKLLNTGVPSYGTVREMLLLDRIDTSRLRCLVIQYDDNDTEENWRFFHNGNTLAIGAQRQYEQDLLRNERRRSYWFPKITFEIVRGAFRPLSLPEPPEGGPRKEARLFLNALLHAGHADLSDVQLVVLQLSPDKVVSSAFAAALTKEIARGDQPDFVQRIEPVDLTGTLEAGDYFALDDHIRASGHRKVAAALADVVHTALAGTP